MKIIEKTQGFLDRETFLTEQMLVAASVKCKNIKNSKTLAFSIQLTVMSWSSGDMNKAM